MADLPSNQSTNIIAGSNVTIVFTETEGDYWDIEIAASGSSGVDVEEDNSALGTASTIDFGTGLDVSFAAGEADVSVDLSELDHGALGGLTDNDHTQYILHAIANAKGDLLAATAADTFTRVAVGSDGDVLTADSGVAAGVSFQAPGAGSHPSFVSHAKFGVD